MRRHLLLVLLPLAAVVGPALSQAGTCDHAYLVEAQPLPAYSGVNTTETGFTSYYWAWGANPSDQGSVPAILVDDGSGVAVSPGVLWANSTSCSGTITGTGLLVEAQTMSSGGRFAVVALQGVEVEVDRRQAGGLQSTAQSIPAPAVTGHTSGSDAFGPYIDVALGWSAPAAAAWAFSDVGPVHVGYAVYSTTTTAGGPVNTGSKAVFTRVEATASGTAPYVTDDDDADDGYLPVAQSSCTVRIRPGEVYSFALALRLDGSGATGGDPQADPSAVETSLVSACSAGTSGSGDLFADGFETGTTGAWSSSVP